MITEEVYEQKVQSLAYVPLRVVAFKAGLVYDPTSSPVKIAFPVIDVDPVIDDWLDASWETIDGNFFARVLVGPTGDIELDRGDYDALVQIFDNPESPVLRAGLLRIT